MLLQLHAVGGGDGDAAGDAVEIALAGGGDAPATLGVLLNNTHRLKLLKDGARDGAGANRVVEPLGRGLHSFAFRLNVSTFRGIRWEVSPFQHTRRPPDQNGQS